MEILSNVRRTICKILVLPRNTSGHSNRNSPSSRGKEISRRGARRRCGLVASVPREILRKIVKGSEGSQEPSSPKVSCTGQVDPAKKKRKKKRKTSKYYDEGTEMPALSRPREAEKERTISKKKKKRKQRLSIPNAVNKGSEKQDFRQNFSDAEEEEPEMKPVLAAAPSLREMKNFKCGRRTLYSFDWKVCDGIVEKDDLHRNSNTETPYPHWVSSF